MPSGIHFDEQPLGRLFTMIGRGYLNLLRSKLQHLDIDRYYYALLLISDHEEITQQELATLLDSNKVSVVRVVDYLSDKGYVNRIRKNDDKRKHKLVLTEKAKPAIAGIRQAFNEMNELVLHGFDHVQMNELNNAISRIKQNITQNTESQ